MNWSQFGPAWYSTWLVPLDEEPYEVVDYLKLGGGDPVFPYNNHVLPDGPP